MSQSYNCNLSSPTYAACQVSHSAKPISLIELSFIKQTLTSLQNSHQQFRTGQTLPKLCGDIYSWLSNHSQMSFETKLTVTRDSQYKRSVSVDFILSTLLFPPQASYLKIKAFNWSQAWCAIIKKPACDPFVSHWGWQLCYFNNVSVSALLQAGHRGQIQKLIFQCYSSRRLCWGPDFSKIALISLYRDPSILLLVPFRCEISCRHIGWKKDKGSTKGK